MIRWSLSILESKTQSWQTSLETLHLQGFVERFKIKMFHVIIVGFLWRYFKKSWFTYKNIHLTMFSIKIKNCKYCKSAISSTFTKILLFVLHLLHGTIKFFVILFWLLLARLEAEMNNQCCQTKTVTFINYLFFC